LLVTKVKAEKFVMPQDLMVDSRFTNSHAHLPWFVAGLGQTDVLLVAMGVFLILFILMFGV
jgi:hypothetical protein